MLSIELEKIGLSLEDIRLVKGKEDPQPQDRIQSNKKSCASEVADESAFALASALDSSRDAVEPGPSISDSDVSRVRETLLSEFSDVFSEKLPSHVSTFSKPGDVTHIIRLKDPQAERPSKGFYPVPHAYYAGAKSLLDEHVRAGRLIPSTAPTAAPVFFKWKKEGPEVQPRMLCDYRLRNANTVRDANSVPTVNEIMHLSRKGKYFATFDLTNAFAQIPMDHKSRKYTAINTPWGCYEWTIMPQGLCNSPATWQRKINQALREHIGIDCFAYVDDIVIYGAKTIDEHIDKCRKVLLALRKANLLVNPKKCIFIAEESELLGHLVSGQGIKPDPKKTLKVENWPAPKNKKQIQRFMGLVNYIRKFLPDLAKNTTSLMKLTRKNIPFRWGHQEQEDFEAIKAIVKQAKVLKTLDYESGEPIWLITDASRTGVGAVLSQGKDWRTAPPVLFESRGYKGDPEKNFGEFGYPIHDQELLAIVNALEKWKPLLLGTKFTICTDHESIKFLMTKKNLSPRQARWSHLLSQFDFEIQYIKGENNKIADALSRYPHEESLKTITVTAGAHDDGIQVAIRKAANQDEAYLVSERDLFCTCKGNPSSRTIRPYARSSFVKRMTSSAIPEQGRRCIR